MKYCENCGAEIAKEAYVCPKCGVKVAGQESTNEEDKPNTGLNILSLFFPIVGFILYFTWNKKTPNKAKSVLTYAAIGFGVSLLLNIINLF